MSTTYLFNLVSVFKALRTKSRIIVFIGALCFICGVGVSFVRSQRFESKVEFFLRNPFYTDRNALFSNDRYIDYFASDDEMNRLIVLSQADSLQDKIIREFHLGTAYNFDTTSPEDLLRLRKTFSKNLNIWRSENRSLELSYVDKKPERAAAIANRVVALLESSLKEFYNETRMSMYHAIMDKIAEEDSMIVVLTDSLAELREQYGIYDIISPSRHNIMLSRMEYNGKTGFAKGMEQIQNIESMKDQLVSDRAKQYSLASQYTTGEKMNSLPLIHIVKSARPAYKALGPGHIMIGMTCGLLGLFFSSIFILIRQYNTGDF